MYTNHPVLSIVLSVVAGVFVAVDGGVLWNDGWFLNLIHPGLGNFSLFYGQTEALAGFSLMALGFAMIPWPRIHIYAGVAIIAVSIASLPGGGGFLLGWLLGIAGGIFAIVFRPKYFYPGPDEFRVARRLARVVYGGRFAAPKTAESNPSEPVSNLRDSSP
jgi:hypothetical protein